MHSGQRQIALEGREPELDAYGCVVCVRISKPCVDVLNYKRRLTLLHIHVRHVNVHGSLGPFSSFWEHWSLRDNGNFPWLPL
jgi:hypothetical protein